VYPARAAEFVKELRAFIGNAELERRTTEYRSPARQRGGLHIARMRERQPLIEAFSAFDKTTMRGARPLRRVPADVGDLANVGMFCHALAPTLDERMTAVHRDKLVSLDGQLRPLLVEWRLAAHYINTRRAEIAWFDIHASAPEFALRANGVEWEVECKRVSHMVAELLGDAEADVLAARVIDWLKQEKLSGELVLRVSLPFAELPADQRMAAVERGLFPLGAGRVSTPDDELVTFTGVLKKNAGERIPANDWYRRAQARRQAGARGYAQAIADKGAAVDPVMLFLEGPQRTSEELVEHLWERKFKKAAGQCTGDRGAVLAFEWEGVDDPDDFRMPVMQALMARTFDEHRHVAAILMGCDPGPTRLNGMTSYGVMAYEASSNVTRFPEVLELGHLIEVR
jgi:hypothetical protein